MAHARNTVLLDFMDDETIGAVERATNDLGFVFLFSFFSNVK